jgi:molecular chaperone GrpE
VKKKRVPAAERAKAIWTRFVNLKAETHMTDQETPQPGAEAKTEECQASGELVETPESIAAERDQLLSDKTDLQNALLRHAAEFDNFRKRTERERNDLCEYAAADAVKALLPVLDDFERALKAPTADTDFLKGIELIYQRMFEVLAKLGLQPIEAVGQPFDPNIHHAIEMVQTDEHEDQTVLADLLRGYTFKGRLLRASMVKVAVRG